jgi:hypothetical protein
LESGIRLRLRESAGIFNRILWITAMIDYAAAYFFITLNVMLDGNCPE